MSLFVMPVSFIRFAARRKNGTESRRNELYELYVLSMRAKSET